MGKICIILLIAVSFVMVLCGCEEIVVTSCDELVSRNWYTKNVSGIGATLEFFGNNAVFTVTENENAEAVISGALAVDSEKFYITCDDLATTFEFCYKVFEDRAEITYNEETLVFYPLRQAEEKDSKQQ